MIDILSLREADEYVYWADTVSLSEAAEDISRDVLGSNVPVLVMLGVSDMDWCDVALGESEGMLAEMAREVVACAP
jgi:hypothetical protein